MKTYLCKEWINGEWAVTRFYTMAAKKLAIKILRAGGFAIRLRETV